MGPKPTTILIPLYVYPSLGAWDVLYERITTYPDRQFILVINPHNGPGATNRPDENYTRELCKLNVYPNVRIIGYVAIGYAKRSLGLVLHDIATYAGWADSLAALRIQGIFLDETPDLYDPDIAEYLETITSTVADTHGLGTMVVHNPGTIPDARYLLLADMTVVFENTYEVLTDGDCLPRLKALAAAYTPDRLACIVHSVPDAIASGAGVHALMDELKEVASAVFVTELCQDYYAHFSPGLLEVLTATT
ncbi:hypothetical protein LTR28_004546 [Elasticomyces elasticus]|nr:hypothetical protein LTR28_004546 [Elasticomyces elasticus]